ncbi:hypothetical protein GOD36_26575 [Sinorhizobium medicae]|nr:hypothetical protein [Sinorhizobium medicae]MDX0826904.1 hypothetical protein [Sinorhizobium medicae]
MKNSSYMTRAMKARDPRYARVLRLLGYQRTDIVAEDPAKLTPKPSPKAEDIAALRKEYLEVVGKRPFHGWDAATIRAKINEVKG